jgi:hypothetical protein
MILDAHHVVGNAVSLMLKRIVSPSHSELPLHDTSRGQRV